MTAMCLTLLISCLVNLMFIVHRPAFWDAKYGKTEHTVSRIAFLIFCMAVGYIGCFWATHVG